MPTIDINHQVPGLPLPPAAGAPGLGGHNLSDSALAGNLILILPYNTTFGVVIRHIPMIVLLSLYFDSVCHFLGRI